MCLKFHLKVVKHCVSHILGHGQQNRVSQDTADSYRQRLASETSHHNHYSCKGIAPIRKWTLTKSGFHTCICTILATVSWWNLEVYWNRWLWRFVIKSGWAALLLASPANSDIYFSPWLHNCANTVCNRLSTVQTWDWAKVKKEENDAGVWGPQ